ncbi:uncharacterized protein LOC143888907 [Tasmannia lanceolata]|uniref:uncharacterized protein LOC143888907 n=1 Tax=Tasmannia lanceolata TaxID=3420 RepID=UPI004063274C
MNPFILKKVVVVEHPMPIGEIMLFLLIYVFEGHINETNNGKYHYMASIKPLARILEDNKLTSPNYVDWKMNLILVLTAAKVYWVLTIDAPELPGPDAPHYVRDRATKWHEDNEMARSYILRSMSNVLLQHVGMASCMDIMYNLKKMFGE